MGRLMRVDAILVVSINHLTFVPSVAQPPWDILSERTEIEAALRDPSLVRPIQHHFPSSTPNSRVTRCKASPSGTR